MKNGVAQSRPHKLFSLLEVIEEEELYRLKRYINSDYFNMNTRIRLLFESLLEARLTASGFKSIDPILLYNETFPERKSGTITDDFSSLMKLVKGYLAQEEYKKDRNAKTRYLLDALQERKAEKPLLQLLNRETKHYEKPEKSKQLQAFHEYYHNWFIAQKKVNYFIVYKRGQLKAKLFKDANDTMDRFFAVVKTAYWATLEQTAQINGFEFNVSYKEFLVKLVKETPIEACPLIYRHYETALLNNSISTVQFMKCKLIYDQYLNRFDHFEQRQFCRNMYNVSAIKSYDPDEMDWLGYKLAFAQEQFIKGFAMVDSNTGKNGIKATTFFNYLRLLIESNKLEEYQVEKKKYQDRVIFPDENNKKANFFYLQIAFLVQKYFIELKRNPKKALFYYEQADYQLEKYEEQIAKGIVDMPDFSLRILFGVLSLKIFYLKENGFNKRRNALHKYLTNFKKLDNVFRIPYLNFVNILLNLYKLRQEERPATKQIKEVHQFLNSEKLIEREWLKERLMEIEK